MNAPVNEPVKTSSMSSNNNVSNQPSTLSKNVSNQPSTLSKNVPQSSNVPEEEEEVPEPVVEEPVVKGKTKKAGLIPKKNSTKKAEPSVEYNSSTGKMVIQLNPAKTMHDLFSSAATCHVDLKAMKKVFTTEYDRLMQASAEEVNTLRNEMLNAEFSQLGADSVVNGLLPMIDDHDFKKLVLKSLLVSGKLNVRS